MDTLELVTTNVQRFNARKMIVVGAILLIGGFLLGFVPQYRSASDLRGELAGREERIQTLEREAKLSRARDLTSLLYLELTRTNYGVAGNYATALFDHLRGAVSDASPQMRSVFNEILSQRDAVTASIARSDPATVTLVQTMLEQLHQLKNP